MNDESQAKTTPRTLMIGVICVLATCGIGLYLGWERGYFDIVLASSIVITLVSSIYYFFRIRRIDHIYTEEEIIERTQKNFERIERQSFRK